MSIFGSSLLEENFTKTPQTYQTESVFISAEDLQTYMASPYSTNLGVTIAFIGNSYMIVFYCQDLFEGLYNLDNSICGIIFYFGNKTK